MHNQGKLQALITTRTRLNRRFTASTASLVSNKVYLKATSMTGDIFQGLLSMNPEAWACPRYSKKKLKTASTVLWLTSQGQVAKLLRLKSLGPPPTK